MNGSYVTETCLHDEQTTCNMNTSSWTYGDKVLMHK